jgi:hypothetical protein
MARRHLSEGRSEPAIRARPLTRAGLERGRPYLPICTRPPRNERAHRTSPDERHQARHIGTYALVFPTYRTPVMRPDHPPTRPLLCAVLRGPSEHAGVR